MYLAIPSQPDCASAWLEAAERVNSQPGHEAHDVLIAVENPLGRAEPDDSIVRTVNEFLAGLGKSVETIANTIFPQSLYALHGAPKFIGVFHEQILPRIRKNERWSGYYFERMTRVPAHDGKTINQLWENIVLRIRDEKNHSLNKFELSLFDPERDVDGSPYGGQCLSFLSFKLVPGAQRQLRLTAVYRNHYYVEKLLGNLIGLGRLMAFVATETGTSLGPLIVHSTHAQIDTPTGKRGDTTQLLKRCCELRDKS